MLDMGNTITAENIEKYKHIVTKSISGKREVIEKGFLEIKNTGYDIFFICSDGVTEIISLTNMINIDLKKLNTMLENNSNDNYSYIYGLDFT